MGLGNPRFRTKHSTSKDSTVKSTLVVSRLETRVTESILDLGLPKMLQEKMKPIQVSI